jgi:hypothetical protein
MSNPKYHHIISQFILRHFSCSPPSTKKEDLEIIRYDMQNGAIGKSKIDKIGGENYFYSVTGKDGKKDNSLEEELSKIEAMTAP